MQADSQFTLTPPVKHASRPGFAAMVALVLFSLWLRMPLVSSGLPYFYHEDEAHHFNRVVEMVKSGEYNPRYFHKPSLHFYLRMPVVAVSFLWNVKEGSIRSIKEIRTRDPYGLGGYAFNASHPGIVKWNRALSVLLSLIAVLLTCAITVELTASGSAALISGLLCAVSPELVANSSIVGVDMLMAVNCLASVYLCLRFATSRTINTLFWAALFAGLAVSSKYNALPISCVPLMAWLLFGRGTTQLACAVIVPAIGFLVGSPFALLSLPLFLDHFAYEIWHYGIAGHEGHSAEPGLTQALFYTRWLAFEDIGIASVICAIAGMLFLFRLPGTANEEAPAPERSRGAVFLLFPVLYFVMMSGQRANFTRNMVALIPFLGVLCAIGVDTLARAPIWKKTAALKRITYTIILGVCLIQPLAKTLEKRNQAKHSIDSRVEAAKFLVELPRSTSEIAVAGELQFAPAHLSRPGLAVIDTARTRLLDLYLDGYDQFLLPSHSSFFREQPDYMKAVKEFAGVEEKQRVIRNPAMVLYAFSDHAIQRFNQNPERRGSMNVNVGASTEWSCTSEDGSLFTDEGQANCWIGKRSMLLEIKNARDIPAGATALQIKVMSPWAGQQLSLRHGGKEWIMNWSEDQITDWQTLTIDPDFDALKEDSFLHIQLRRVQSPLVQGLSEDSRRLGVAISSIDILKSGE